MKNLFIIALCVALLASCSQGGYEIAGTVDKADLNGKYVYLYQYGPDVEVPADSALVENGTFKITGNATTPQLYVLEFNVNDVAPQRPSVGSNNPYTATFILENAKLKAELTEAPTVTGSPENDAWTALQKEIKDINNSDSEETLFNYVEYVKNYILQNQDKQSAAKLLFDFRYYLDEEFRREAISKASGAFLAVPNIDKMVEHLAILEKVSIGKKFADIALNDPEGNPIKLSDYAGKGKVVLIDFWASWCPPCRADMPHLVSVYGQYKDKGFEIIGLSLDRNNEDWVKGINELNITWPQMSDLKYWQSEGAALYGVNSIPHTVLIDKDGTIIAKNLRGKSLDEKLVEILQ